VADDVVAVLITEHLPVGTLLVNRSSRSRRARPRARGRLISLEAARSLAPQAP
jgi:hypothetical protein